MAKAVLQRRAVVVLAKSLNSDARILVLGAGGGPELRVFADLQPSWRLVGKHPSAQMLDLATLMDGPALRLLRALRPKT